MEDPVIQAPAAEEGSLTFYWRTIVRPHKRFVLFLVAFTGFGSLLEVVTLALTVPLVETLTTVDLKAPNRPLMVVRTVAEFLGLPAERNVLLLVILVTASILFASQSLCMMLIELVTSRAANRRRAELQLRLLRHYVEAPYLEIVGRKRATIMHDINSTADALQRTIGSLSAMVMQAGQAVFLLGLMLFLSWWATIMIGLTAVFGVRGIRKLLDHRARVHGDILYRNRAGQRQVEIDAIDGFKVVKAQGLEDRLVGTLDTLLNTELQSVNRLFLFRRSPAFFDEAVAAGIVVALAALSLLLPEWGLVPPKLAAFLIAIRRCSPAVAGINASLVELNGARRDVQAISDVFERLAPERKNGGPIGDIREVQVSNVSVIYPARPEQPAVRDVSATFARGTITALVGPTGSGKSTLVHLILGLIPPTSGSVLVDDTPLDALSLADWRRHIGFVPQDAFLFNASIRENIVLWDPNASQADVERAAKIAELHDFIAGLPQGYDTVVGDRGVALSGGQGQRLAIARAVFRRPRVFVFDEATSALDNTTERAVYDAIRMLREDAIVIVVAHRLSTVREADQIVVMESGRVVEVGGHAALLDRGGLYARLFNVDAVAG